ncbi:MAG: DEAD/DEAH box helicase, partial [Natronospirillum sp.]|uniref:helicase-related protein n=1 Tax=Natronospirillum sp. TaxID=2812955 RepID=UPI0025DA40B8
KRGVDRLLTWDFQMHGLVEALMTRTGQVMAWEMGLGKGRLALALALMGGKHSLIMVEPYLVDELAIEITDFGLADDEWQVIERPEDARDLKRINIITYNRLRQPLQMIANATPAQKRRARTYADLLAKRISIAVADEGSLLAHESTAQSRAIAKLHPKRRYILDGTPNANYPRDALPLMTWVAGDSTALQQYGRWHYSLDERAYKSAAYLEQGRTEFSRRFVTLSMGSHEDGSEFRSEIPMIQDVIGYRQWLAPLVSRRLQGEPEVARHVQIEPPLARKVVLKWDRDHFSHYHRVSTDFSRFYESQLRLRVEEGKNINFAVTLARVGACVRAANMPQLASSNFARLDSPATTKQRYAAARSIELAEAGEKVIVYVDGPEQVERLCDLIRAQGHDVVGLHGQMAIKRRTRALNEQFRFGPVMILVASIQCCRRGLNIHQASRVIMYSRHWSYSTERQAIFRTCRPLQTRQVRAEFLELQGSIDEYQNQVVMYKRECEQVGLDWATPTLTEDRFMHMDTLFSTFCQDLASLGESLVFSADDQDLVLTEEPEFVY